MDLDHERWGRRQVKKSRPKKQGRSMHVENDSAGIICCFDLDGSLTFVNDEYCQYFGGKTEDLIGQPVVPFIQTQVWNHSDGLFSTVNKNNPAAVTKHKFLLPNGEVRWQQWTSRAIFDSNGILTEFQAVGRDLGKRLRPGDTSREGEVAYHTLIAKMCHGFALNEFICDKNGQHYDSRFLEVNPAFERITGLNKKELIGKTVRQVFPGTEYFWVTYCGKVALTGKPAHLKNISKLYNRYFEVVAYSPQKSQVAVVFTDISKRVKTENALRESENNFRELAGNANDGILIAGDSGNLVYTNRRVSEISGYSVSELLKLNFQNLAHPDEIKKLDAIYQRRMAGDFSPVRYETILIKRNGDSVPIEVTDSETVWHKQSAMIKIIRDITMRKQIEETLGKVNSELERRVQERTLELLDIAEKLEENQQELLRHKLDLEKANKELVQTNTALSVLARNINKKRDAFEGKIAQTISAQILPVVEDLKSDKITEKSRAKLEVLSAYLIDLTPNRSKSHNVIISLSAMELRVAVMIKNGFSSKEIARLLHISPHTVKTHRRSIRRKLSIKNSRINLSSYLRFKLGKVSNDPLPGELA